MKGEIILNGEILYKYVKPESLPQGQTEIPFGIFEDKELSCDWEKLQGSPEKSFHVKEGKNIIIQISVCDEIKNPQNPKRVGQFVAEWKQDIIHDPISQGEDLSHPTISNLSHSLIKGLKKAAVTKAIASNSKIYKVATYSEETLHQRNIYLITELEFIIVGTVMILILVAMFLY